MLNLALRLILALWVLGYLAIACAPLFGNDVGTGIVGLVVGGVLLIPWVIGIVVLGGLVWLTTPRRRL